MKLPPKNTLLLSLCLSLLPLMNLPAVILVSDTFADNDRTTQNLPGSMAFFSGSSSGNLTVASNQMTFTTSGAGRTFLGYFGTNAAGTDKVSLGVGDNITVQFSFSMAGTVVSSDNTIRLGLFDSSTRISADNFGNSNAAFNGYDGYAVMMNPGITTANAVRLFDRTTPTSTALLSTFTDYTLGANTAGTTAALSTGQTYTGQLVATRSAASTLDVSFQITGGGFNPGDYSVSHSFTSGITSTFDTFAFYNAAAQTLNYTFNSFTVTTSSIPEPSTFALMGTALLGFHFLRVRRRQE